MKKTLKLQVLALIFLLTSPALFPESIKFSTDRMSGSIKEGANTTTLSGHAIVSTETMEITADTIILSGKDYRYIEATGSVTGIIQESQIDFTCTHMTYDRETKIATLSEDVHLIDGQNNVSAEAQIIEYNQETDIAVMQINVRITQENNLCTAAYAVYKKSEQMLNLTGNPNVTQGSDTFRAQQISLNLETQQITLDGRVRGSVSSTTNSTTSQSTTTGATTGATTGTTAAKSAPASNTSNTSTTSTTSNQSNTTN